MKIYLNCFFNDMDLTPFSSLFTKVFGVHCEFGNFLESEILLESVFGNQTALNKKTWKYSFLFIGESDRRLPLSMSNRLTNNIPKDKYSCILKGEVNNANVVNFPLFVLYTYSFNFTTKFINPPLRVSVPPKNVCVIMSNIDDSEGRNFFCECLEKYIKIDYAGAYKNNVPRIMEPHCTPKFVEFISQYKFIITMENSKNKHYITEKILHGFSANTIPVYWGSDYVCDYFNEERFINVKSFSECDIKKAIQHILLLVSDKKMYLEMVNKPIYKDSSNPITLDTIAHDIQQLLIN
jgi:hypothetical protein